MGFGVTEGCLKTIRECNVSHAHVNQFLDCQGDELASELARLKQQATGLAAQEQAGQASILDVLVLRARTSELALKAANAAVLPAGSSEERRVGKEVVSTCRSRWLSEY